MQMPEPIITVIRPELTAEERAERQKKVEKCISDFWIACKRKEAEREAKRLESKGKESE
jgi:sulfur transfer protein SufE